GPGGKELLERPDIKTTLKAGVRALVVLPIAEAGRGIGAFCLQSTQKGIYDAETRRTLERLMLDQAVLAVFHAAERAQSDFVGELVKKIAGSQNLQELAGTVVAELARFYKFHIVSIYKVNALRGHFRLLAQALGPEDEVAKTEAGFAIPEGHTQSIDKGMLALAYSQGKPKILKDVLDKSVEAQSYQPVATGMRSALCVPIRMFGRILWILNVEDRHTDAFTPEEVEA